MQMIIMLVLWAAPLLAQVSHLPILPEVANVEFGVSTRIVPEMTAFKQTFPALGYDIGGAVYETNKVILND